MKSLVIPVGILISTISSFGQTSATATVDSRVTVIEPINITKTVDLDFGNVISAYNPGTVVLSPDGSRIANGVQISNTFPGNVSPAEAQVNHGNNKYSITLPDSFSLYSREDPNQTIVIDDFQVSPNTGEIMDILKIGATLNLKANQPAGFYTNTAGFNVTVSYN
ncbi:DUF4402 domain-containing protein [Salinimicrobium flavum]|uniref:DUF4402 domain-containing protein n=1 Tax=Salinimicrobium flavum TaxID=1737065 RepID=A0ABW5J168_9FLAO